ncbi:MAG: glycosyltransferase [Bryobacterales bacterium]|nr:glycosyltransferase [Bryobacterales bacterium]
MPTVFRLLKGLPLLLLSPILLIVSLLWLLLADAFFLLFGRKRKPADTLPRHTAGTVVIPNWNGRDLLEKYLPSVVTALAGNPENEILVVDNGSTDGSVAYLREHFPTVTVLAQSSNLGFGGGSNAGFRAARNDIVVLLNSDMRVAPDFLQPLLDGFTDDKVFAVSCQIFFTDPNKARQETGLTQAWWNNGRLGVRHRLDDAVTGIYPCFYAGGGSSAYDRAKFLELGGFDSLFHPFYLEDTDLGIQAWKRGWKVFYQPRSVVWHEHRGTIGRTHKPDYINTIVQKNFLLFLWKNIHESRKLFHHFARSFADAFLTYLAGPSPERTSCPAIWGAFRQLPGAASSRWRARSLSVTTDTEAFRRPLGAYFHDHFGTHQRDPERLSVLFLSPYAIYPPIHGGGVFMYGTTNALASRCLLHLIAVLDEEWQIPQHDPLASRCASANFLVRLDSKVFTFGSIRPHAVTEFASADLEWMIHRTVFLNRVDVLQIEYTNMGQYAGQFRNIVTALFEHDVYFQSIGRGLAKSGSASRKASAAFEYFRALRYELRTLPRMDLVQVCSKENKEYLLSFLPDLKDRIDDTLRAGIDTTQYTMHTGARDPFTMLFLGSFRHIPNQEALDWFAKLVLPRVVERCPRAKLVIIGSDPPPRHSLPVDDKNIEIRGFVENLYEPFARYAVFVCPILSGSGVRVKLLEAFCTGIPAVSTFLGAEGLTAVDGEICRLADDPGEFATRILELFNRPGEAAGMVQRAHSYVTTERDITRMTVKLLDSYRSALRRKREHSATSPEP